MCSCYLLVTFGEGRGGKRLLPRCSAGTRLPICHCTGSRGVGSGCGGGSFHAFWPPEPVKKIERCQVILITLNVSGWQGGGEGEVGAGGCGSRAGVCLLGLEPSVSKCTLIYIRRSEPHLLMHRQIWAPLLPLSRQHTLAAGAGQAGAQDDACGMEPRHIPGIMMLSWVRAHSRPIPFLGPVNPSSLHKTPQWLPPWDAHCCRTAHLLHQGFLDPATSFDPGRTLRIIQLQKGLHGVEDKQGCISLFPFLTREELTVDPVPLKPCSGGPGTVTIWVFTSPHCWRCRQKRGS